MVAPNSEPAGGECLVSLQRESTHNRENAKAHTEMMHLRRSEGDNSGVARLSTKRQSLTAAIPGKRTDSLPVRLTSQDQGVVIDAHKLHRAIGISDRDDRLTWVTRNLGYA